MRKRTHTLAIFILSILIIAILDCVPSSYQSPRVLKPGEVTLGAGFSFAKYDYIIPVDLSPCFRYGIFDKADLGFKISGFSDIGYGLHPTVIFGNDQVFIK